MSKIESLEPLRLISKSVFSSGIDDDDDLGDGYSSKVVQDCFQFSESVLVS